MLKNPRKYLALLGALVICVSASGQYTQSSYSLLGIGDVNFGDLTANSSMGGVGLSYNSKYYVNTLNPALFGMNENAVFHIGGGMDFRNFTNGTETYKSSTGSFKDFAISLPMVLRKWNLGLGITPLSNVNYSYRITDTNGPAGTSAISELTGDGGLDEFYITNGFKLGNFFLGVKAGLVFGSITDESRSFLEGVDNTTFGHTVVISRRNFKDVRFQLGAAYKLKLSDDSFLNFGATLNQESKINGTLLRLLDQQSVGGNIFSRDTLFYTEDPAFYDESTRGPAQIVLPSRFGFGISYEKYQKLNLGFDFHTQDWKSYRSLLGDPETNFDRSFRVAVGGEIIPNAENNGVFGLLSYRFGLHYEKTPYLVNSEQVNDFGISFGTSLPLGAFWGLSTVNVGATLGRRGSVGDGLVKENYFKLNFGFSVQDITWFTRQKFN